MSASYPPQGGTRSDAASRVSAPAISIIVVTGIGIAFAVLGILVNILGIGLGGMAARDERIAQYLSGSMGVVSGLIGIAVGGFIIFGALKMKDLSSYGLALAAAILVMVPCLSPCCFLGIPVGIWALVVLLNQDVKRAFSS
jgi:predicted lysophospholipase L1 biosynthesis ABC-type transport system permease subunit